MDDEKFITALSELILRIYGIDPLGMVNKVVRVRIRFNFTTGYIFN